VEEGETTLLVPSYRRIAQRYNSPLGLELISSPT
jgi:hypothetical protein